MNWMMIYFIKDSLQLYYRTLIYKFLLMNMSINIFNKFKHFKKLKII